MKNLKFLPLVLFLFCYGKSNGQEDTYKIWKDYYTQSDFSRLNEKPVYSPTIAGLANILYSGIGHFYVDEPERGKKFMKAELITEGIAVISTVAFTYTLIAAGTFHADDPFTGVLLVGSGLYLYAFPFIIVAIRTICTLDAIKIAKVKSVAYSTSTLKPISLQLLPEIKHQNFGMNTNSVVCGLNLKLTF